MFTVFVTELFPTDIRNSALGTGNTFGRLGALCGSLIVSSPVLAHFDLAVLGLTYLGRLREFPISSTVYMIMQGSVLHVGGKPTIPLGSCQLHCTPFFKAKHICQIQSCLYLP